MTNYITAIGFGKTSPKVYGELVADHPIDWNRWQVVNCYSGKASLINSGRKAFQRPMKEGVELFHAIQDVFLSPQVTVA